MSHQSVTSYDSKLALFLLSKAIKSFKCKHPGEKPFIVVKCYPWVKQNLEHSKLDDHEFITTDSEGFWPVTEEKITIVTKPIDISNPKQKTRYININKNNIKETEIKSEYMEKIITYNRYSELEVADICIEVKDQPEQENELEVEVGYLKESIRLISQMLKTMSTEEKLIDLESKNNKLKDEIFILKTLIEKYNKQNVLTNLNTSMNNENKKNDNGDDDKFKKTNNDKTEAGTQTDPIVSDEEKEERIRILSKKFKDEHIKIISDHKSMEEIRERIKECQKNFKKQDTDFLTIINKYYDTQKKLCLLRDKVTSVLGSKNPFFVDDWKKRVDEEGFILSLKIFL